VDAGHQIGIDGLIYQAELSPMVAPPPMAMVSGTGTVKAGPNIIHLTVLATDHGGQSYYARSQGGLQFLTAVECLSVAPDGSSAVVAGPARAVAGNLPDGWAQLEILEGGEDTADMARVAFVSAEEAARCEASGDYPGTVVEGDFVIQAP
jgi:hypothetical protein